jgi:hypothetical protein
MAEQVSVEPEVSVSRDGADVVLALSTAAALRLAEELDDTGSDHTGWCHDVARLLKAAVERESAPTAETEASHTVLLRGNWSSDGDLDGPLPFTEAHPLETIGPGLVGVWRTRLAGQAVASGRTADEAEAVSTERLDAAARLVDAVAAAKADASTAASMRAVETRMEGARAALVARVSAVPVEVDPGPRDRLPEQHAGPNRRRPATPDA